MELGFKATKLFSPWGPEQGLEGLNRLEELVAGTRETIGDEVELMLDGWTAYDAEYTVRVAERMRPYNLKWLEDYIQPEDLLGLRVDPAAIALADPGYRRALVQPGALRPRCGQASRGHFPAGRALVRRHYSGRQDMPPSAGEQHFRHCSRRDELPLWPAPIDGDAGGHMGRTFGGRFGAGCTTLAEMVKLPGTAVIEDGYLRPSDATRIWSRDRRCMAG